MNSLGLALFFIHQIYNESNNILEEKDWGFRADVLMNMYYQDEITHHFKQIYERGDEERKNRVLKVGELFGNTDLLALSEQ